MKTKYAIRKETLRTGETITVIHADDGRQFFAEEENNDYQQYLAWLAEGNTPEEWNPEVNNG